MAEDQKLEETQTSSEETNNSTDQGPPSEETPDESQENLIKTFPTEKKSSSMKTFTIVIVILIAGVISGYFLSTLQGGSKNIKTAQSASEEGLSVGDVFGLPDDETFRDISEGVMVKGGTDGEGSHHLVRPGGESQNVYLTSSVVDLDLFVDHRVKIWGETFSAQQAGWLMDVGRIEILELNVQIPSEGE